jgi:hypothetical protein
LPSLLRTQAAQIPTISPDGYIRLPLATLTSLPFIHLTSDIDPQFLAELKSQTVAAQTAGFSEWTSDTTPAISLGWGWFIHNQSKCLLLAPDIVRSNVMLIDIHGYDLGTAVTSNLFCTWLAVYDWQKVVSCELRAFMVSSC